MKKEVIKVPQGNHFFEIIQKKLGENENTWVYLNQQTIDTLSKKEGVPYLDVEAKFHIPYGGIVIDDYRGEYSWYRIHSIDAVKYCAASDPNEVIFISI